MISCIKELVKVAENKTNSIFFKRANALKSGHYPRFYNVFKTVFEKRYKVFQ